MLSRRTALLAPLAAAVSAAATKSKIALSIHQNSSRGAGFQKSLEGWSKAGIKNAELSDALLDDFLKTNSIDAARRLLSDLGLTPVSATAGLTDVWVQGPERAAKLEAWKKRCEQFSALGLTRFYCPATVTRKVTMEDYKAAPAMIREVGDITKPFKLTAMIEFSRNSVFISTLTTALKVIREAAHPNVAPMLDFYHFWSGMGKFEDLDQLRPGEIVHCHFQDVPNMPRELLDQTTRVLPGDGVTPMDRILRKLADKGYAGALSVELFLPEFQQADPYELARRIREKAEAVMRKARVA